MFKVIVTARGWFHTTGVIINDIDDMETAKRIGEQLETHYYVAGYRKVTATIILVV